jgi:hypothetical protein
MEKMSKTRIIAYKTAHKTTPKCRACNKPIRLGEAITVIKGVHHTKYLCSQCTKKPLVIYQKTQPHTIHYIYRYRGNNYKPEKP